MYRCRDDMPLPRRKCVLNVNGSKVSNIESSSHILASVPSKVKDLDCLTLRVVLLLVMELCVRCDRSFKQLHFIIISYQYVTLELSYFSTCTSTEIHS